MTRKERRQMEKRADEMWIEAKREVFGPGASVQEEIRERNSLMAAFAMCMEFFLFFTLAYLWLLLIHFPDMKIVEAVNVFVQENPYGKYRNQAICIALIYVQLRIYFYPCWRKKAEFKWIMLLFWSFIGIFFAVSLEPFYRLPAVLFAAAVCWIASSLVRRSTERHISAIKREEQKRKEE